MNESAPLISSDSAPEREQYGRAHVSVDSRQIRWDHAADQEIWCSDLDPSTWQSARALIAGVLAEAALHCAALQGDASSVENREVCAQQQIDELASQGANSQYLQQHDDASHSMLSCAAIHVQLGALAVLQRTHSISGDATTCLFSSLPIALWHRVATAQVCTACQPTNLVELTLVCIPDVMDMMTQYQYNQCSQLNIQQVQETVPLTEVLDMQFIRCSIPIHECNHSSIQWLHHVYPFLRNDQQNTITMSDYTDNNHDSLTIQNNASTTKLTIHMKPPIHHCCSAASFQPLPFLTPRALQTPFALQNLAAHSYRCPSSSRLLPMLPNMVIAYCIQRHEYIVLPVQLAPPKPSLSTTLSAHSFLFELSSEYHIRLFLPGLLMHVGAVYRQPEQYGLQYVQGLGTENRPTTYILGMSDLQPRLHFVRGGSGGGGGGDGSSSSNHSNGALLQHSLLRSRNETLRFHSTFRKVVNPILSSRSLESSTLQLALNRKNVVLTPPLEGCLNPGLFPHCFLRRGMVGVQHIGIQFANAKNIGPVRTQEEAIAYAKHLMQIVSRRRVAMADLVLLASDHPITRASMGVVVNWETLEVSQNIINKIHELPLGRLSNIIVGASTVHFFQKFYDGANFALVQSNNSEHKKQSSRAKKQFKDAQLSSKVRAQLKTATARK